MKKSILVVVMTLFCVGYAIAQPRAIGARLGWGVAFSYEHSLGNNMLSLDVDVPGFDGVGAAVTYDWINPFGTAVPWNHRGEWNWYMGVGASGGFRWGGVTNNAAVRHSYVGAAGRIGIEYNFWVPVQLSLDWRPTLGIRMDYGANNVDFYSDGLYAGSISLGIRYKF